MKTVIDSSNKMRDYWYNLLETLNFEYYIQHQKNAMGAPITKIRVSNNFAEKAMKVAEKDIDQAVEMLKREFIRNL
jgi:hypothetical protein